MSTQGPFNQLLKLSRASIECDGNVCRIVFHSQVIPIKDGLDLAKYVADRAPLFYREPQKISEQLADGYFLSTVKAALGRLPTADSFQNSHFAEIASGIFAEEVMDLSLLYSKLSLLTAENANAFKMDLVLFDSKPDPIEFVFGEVNQARNRLHRPATIAVATPISSTRFRNTEKETWNLTWPPQGTV